MKLLFQLTALGTLSLALCQIAPAQYASPEQTTSPTQPVSVEQTVPANRSPQPLRPVSAEPTLTITHAIERAIEYSFDLRREHAYLERAQAERSQAGLLPNPVANYTREDLNADDRTYSEWTAAVAYPLLSLFTRGARIDAAALDVTAAEHRVIRKSDDVRYDTQLRFVELWASRRTLEAYHEMETDVRQLMTATEQRAARGDISPYDEQRLRTELARLQWRMTEAIETKRSAENALAFLFGMTADSLAHVSLSLPRLTADALNADALVRTALRQRRDLLALESARTSAKHRGDWLRRRWMEDITLGGGYKKQSDAFDGAVISLSLPLPLFDRNQGDASAAEAKRSALAFESESLKRRIERDVRQAVASYETLSAQARRLPRPASGDYGRMLTAASSAYSEGEFTLVEYIDAITAYMEGTELDIHVRVSLLRAAFAVEHAAGDSVFSFNESN